LIAVLSAGATAVAATGRQHRDQAAQV